MGDGKMKSDQNAENEMTEEKDENNSVIVGRKSNIEVEENERKEENDAFMNLEKKQNSDDKIIKSEKEQMDTTVSNENADIKQIEDKDNVEEEASLREDEDENIFSSSEKGQNIVGDGKMKSDQIVENEMAEEKN